MKSLILLGRGSQYFAFCLCALLVVMEILQPTVGLAVGLSMSYLLPTALLAFQVSMVKAT